ncbi:MAG: PKD domain-containing protein [Candidatus Competibacteraceae bacterium]
MLKNIKTLFSLVNNTYSLLALISVISLFYNTAALAGQVTLTWKASPSPNVSGYRIYYGQDSGSYTSIIDVGFQTTSTVFDLQEGVTYYFAVKAYDGNNNESGFSNEVSTTIGSSAINLIADFSANPTLGVAPLPVVFINKSTGNIDTWSWDFGDGSTSTSSNPTHTYMAKGIYTVYLTITGPIGTNTKALACYIKVCRVGANGRKRCPRQHCS